MSVKIQEQVTWRTIRALAEIVHAAREKRQLVWSDGGERVAHVQAQQIVNADWDPLPDDVDVLGGYLLVKTSEGALERRWTVGELADDWLNGLLAIV